MKQLFDQVLHLKELYSVIWLMTKSDDYYLESSDGAWTIRKRSFESGFKVQTENSIVKTMVSKQWISPSNDGAKTYRLTEKGKADIDQVLVARDLARELEKT